MKEGFIIREQEKAHFITATVVDWIDVFTRKNYRDCIIDCLDFCIKNKDLTVYGYVIMSNHIHLIILSKDGNVRSELNSQGMNYGQRESYIAVPDYSSVTPTYLPFDKTALSNLKNGNAPNVNTMYIQIN